MKIRNIINDLLKEIKELKEENQRLKSSNVNNDLIIENNNLRNELESLKSLLEISESKKYKKRISKKTDDGSSEKE